MKEFDGPSPPKTKKPTSPRPVRSDRRFYAQLHHQTEREIMSWGFSHMREQVIRCPLTISSTRSSTAVVDRSHTYPT